MSSYKGELGYAKRVIEFYDDVMKCEKFDEKYEYTSILSTLLSVLSCVMPDGGSKFHGCVKHVLGERNSMDYYDTFKHFNEFCLTERKKQYNNLLDYFNNIRNGLAHKEVKKIKDSDEEVRNFADISKENEIEAVKIESDIIRKIREKRANNGAYVQTNNDELIFKFEDLKEILRWLETLVNETIDKWDFIPEKIRMEQTACQPIKTT